MDKQKEVGNEQQDVFYINALKNEAQKATKTKDVENVFTLVLDKSSEYWLSIFKDAILENSNSVIDRKHRIFAKLLIPKLNQIDDIFLIGNFMTLFTQKFGEKRSLKKDDAIYLVLEALEKRDLAIRRQGMSSIGSAVLQFRKKPKATNSEQEEDTDKESVSKREQARSLKPAAALGAEVIPQEKKESEQKQPLDIWPRAGNRERSKLNVKKADPASELLITAAREGKEDDVRKALASGANIDYDSEEDFGMTPLHIAIYKGHEHIAQLLVQAKASIHKARKHALFGSTALCLALLKGENNIAKLLIASGAPVNEFDISGCAPIHLAASNEDDPATIQALIAAGANIHAKTKDGETALHKAAHQGNIKIAQILLENGAEKGAQNKTGATPADKASAERHRQMTALLTDTKYVPDPGQEEEDNRWREEQFSKMVEDIIKAKQ